MTAIRVEFEVTDNRYPFVGISDRTGCRFTMEKVVPTVDEGYLELFEVTGVGGAELTMLLEREFDVEFDMVTGGETRNLVLLSVDEPYSCPVATLGEEGAIWQSARAEDGVGEIVASVPSTEANGTLEAMATEHPGAELRSKHTEQESDLAFVDGASRFIEQRLTDRQQEVLEIAVANGYFENPRGVTGADLAARMGISQTTFSQHLRAAQRKIFADLLEVTAGSATADE